VPDESTGFEPEPTYPLAEQAENQVLRERLYAAQNALVRLQNERAGIAAALQVVLRGQEWRMLKGTGEFRQAFEGLLDVAWPPSGALAERSVGHDKPEHVNAVPGTAQGRVTVSREDLRAVVDLAAGAGGRADVTTEQLAAYRRMFDAARSAGEAQPS
jgi:hypothetical protein